MKFLAHLRAIAFILALISPTLIVSCGELEGNEANEHGGGSGSTTTATTPVSTVTCSSNCSAAGACADHGGVACSQGPDSDGSVICADGYKGSSIKYQCL